MVIINNKSRRLPMNSYAFQLAYYMKVSHMIKGTMHADHAGNLEYMVRNDFPGICHLNCRYILVSAQLSSMCAVLKKMGFKAANNGKLER